ncbi:hypothetical protein OG394_20775 [Kribbella sp. NBC_01245]|uniref:hypothetical protein n=1 Tax=Kribbella sp. NBC_01245 TaxID=2903578 RepID=UPI002E29289D|nr:hypothetical protein [Kribbella sp. NBC_01245]
MSAEQEIFNEFKAFGRGMSSLLKAMHKRVQARQQAAAREAHLRVLVDHFVRERLRDSRRSDPDLDRTIDRHNPPGPDHDRRLGEHARDGVNGPDPEREAELDREREERDEQREDREEERDDREEERDDQDEEREDQDENRGDDRDEQREEREEEAESENENDDTNQPQAQPELDAQQDLDPGRDPEHEREKAKERERDRERDDLAPDAVDPALAAGAAGAAGAAALQAQSELDNNQLDEPARTEPEQETSGPEAEAPDQVDRDITAGPEAAPLAGPDPQAVDELRDAKVEEAHTNEPPAGPNLEVADKEPETTKEAQSEAEETVDRTEETEREVTELESDPASPYASDETKLEAETASEVETGVDSEYDAETASGVETDPNAPSPYVSEEVESKGPELDNEGVNPYVSDGEPVTAQEAANNQPGQTQLTQAQLRQGQQGQPGAEQPGRKGLQDQQGQTATAQHAQPARSPEMNRLHEMGVGGVSPAAGAAQRPGQAPSAQSHAGTTPGAHHQRAQQTGKQQQAGKEV